MAMIPHQAHKAPASRARINWNNPITRGLLFAYLPGKAYNVVNPRQVHDIGNTGTTRRGNSLHTSGTQGNGWIFDRKPLLGPLYKSTVVTVGLFADSYRVLYCERSNGNNIYKLETGLRNSTAGIGFTYRNNTANLLQLYQPAPTGIIHDGQRLFALVKSGNTHSVWSGLVGKSAGATANDFSLSGSFPYGNEFTDGSEMFRTLGHDPYDGEQPSNGRFDLQLGFSRDLSQDELYSLRANPWQVFQPDVDDLYVFSAVAKNLVSSGGQALNVTGFQPSLVQANNLFPGNAQDSVVGYTPAMAQARNLFVDSTLVQVTGFVPLVAQAQGLGIATDVLNLTGYAPLIQQGRNMLFGTDGLDITGFAPSITHNSNMFLGTGLLGVTGFSPVVAHASPLNVDTGRIGVQGFVPMIAQSTNVDAQTGSVEVTGYIPSISQAHPISLVLEPGTFSVVGYAPSVSHVRLPALQLVSAGKLRLRNGKLVYSLK